jgi:hypothetical protein
MKFLRIPPGSRGLTYFAFVYVPKAQLGGVPHWADDLVGPRARLWTTFGVVGTTDVAIT